MPIETFTESGATILNTDLMDQGLCIGTLTASPGAYVTKQYPSLNGCGILAMASTGGGGPGEAVVSYPGGVPTVTLAPTGGYPNYATIWAYGTRAVEPASGLWASTPSGTISMAPEAHGLHFAGRATFVQHVASSGDQQWGGLGYSEFYFDSPTPPAVSVRLEPGQWGSLLSVSPQSGNRWQIIVRVTGDPDAAWPAWPALQQPVVACFTKATATPGSEFAIFDESASLTWNLCQPNLLYPVKWVRLPMGQSTSIPAGAMGFVGSALGYAISEDGRDEFNEFPEWWIYSHAEGAWHRDQSGNLRATTRRYLCTGQSGEPQSPGDYTDTSSAIVINMSNY